MILDKFMLNGKTALVTGCSRGIGKAIAIGFAEAGADIIGVSRTGEMSETSKTIKSLGKSFSRYACDFSNRSELHLFIKKIKTNHSQIDILLNNAGTIMRNPASEHSDEYWDKVIEVNLNSQFILSREIGKGMLESGNGKIVFIASLLSFQGGVTVPGYAASKGGIKTLIMALSNEWASKGINVNGIAPGYISTDNTEALRNNLERNRAILERIPSGRWGEAEDLAGAAVFLCSDASNYLSGTIITVDGGWMGR